MLNYVNKLILIIFLQPKGQILNSSSAIFFKNQIVLE